MADLAITPNIERLVTDFLRAQPEVQAAVGDRVYTAIPKAPKTGPDTRFPCLRCTLIFDDNVTSQPSWVHRFDVQIEGFGGSKEDAWRAATIAHAAIDARITGVHTQGVVNGVEQSGMNDLPDESFEPAKPRFLFTSTITAHPLATVPAS